MSDTAMEILTLIVRLAVVVIIGILVPRLRTFLRDKQIDGAVQKAVYTAQQLLYEEPGKDRKKFAVNMATELLEKIGLKIDDGQLSALIEAAVLEMNIAKGKYQYDYMPEAVADKTEDTE